MKLGIDVDGVLADFNQAFVQRVIEVTGENKFPAWPFAITTWDYPVEQFGYTKAQQKAAWDSVCKDPSFWRELPKYPWTDAAMESLADLWQDNHDLYFITSRVGINPKNQTEMWLDAFNSVPPTVLISSEKGLCCKALNLDLYIDDKTENCMDVKARSPKTICLMLTQPWNQPVQGVPRIATMDEFFTTIQEASDAVR